MKELKFICCQPDDVYYLWQTHLWLESLKSLGLSNKATVLIFVPNFREYNKKWDVLIPLYPEVEFKVYKDEDNISNLFGIYIPILRPYLLWKYWSECPDMENKAVFYCDNDVLFTESFNIEKFIDDDVCYLSDTNGYINASYFDSKIKDVRPERLEQYKTIDVLNETARFAGVTREIAEKNNLNSGGAQYLLKNINTKFWWNMIENTINIRLHLQGVNQSYFKDENAGFQSWCADMWGLLWGLWREGKETRVVKEMNFAWATDSIEKLDACPLYHNAGVTEETIHGYVPAFYKSKYHLGTDPTKDRQMDVVLSHPKSKEYCTWWYTKQLDDLRKKYNLNY